MCPQAKFWQHRNAAPIASAAPLAADQAWLAKCLADRRRAQNETGMLHTHYASLRTLETATA